jgi:hypothetical protein
LTKCSCYVLILAMQDFADMAEAHEWTLRRLREMAGRLTEQAYLRASDAAALRDDEAQARWMLIFDRMARGLRLSMALEARLARERRWDADEIEREAAGVRHEPRWRRAAGSPSHAETGESEPYESDRERDDDGLPHDAPLSQRIGRLKAIIEGAGAPEPEPRLARAERRALEAQRAERALRAASPCPPDEPWDVLTIDAIAGYAPDDPPWRGSG